MNHEFIVGTSLALTAHPQLSLRGSPLHSLSLDGRIFVIDMSMGSSRWAIAPWSNWGPRPIFLHMIFSLSRSIWLCYLEVSVEEGKLAKGWCDCVKCPDMVSVLLK
jgi:hypothetical protein